MFFENAAILSSVFLFNDHKQRDIRIVIFANSSVLTQYTDTRTLFLFFSFFLSSFISFLLRVWEQFMAYTKLFDWFSLNELFDTGTENIYRRVMRAEERQGCGSQGGKTYIKREKRRRICSRRCILMLLNGFFCFTHTFVMFLSLPKAFFALHCLIPRLFFIPFFFYLSLPPLPFFRRENTVRTLPSLARRTYSLFFSNRKLLSVLFYLERALSVLEFFKDFLSLLFLLLFHRGTYVIGVLRVTISSTKILRRPENSNRLTTLITCFVIRVSSQRIFIVQLYLFFSFEIAFIFLILLCRKTNRTRDITNNLSTNFPCLLTFLGSFAAICSWKSTSNHLRGIFILFPKSSRFVGKTFVNYAIDSYSRLRFSLFILRQSISSNQVNQLLTLSIYFSTIMKGYIKLSASIYYYTICPIYFVAVILFITILSIVSISIKPQWRSITHRLPSRCP